MKSLHYNCGFAKQKKYSVPKRSLQFKNPCIIHHLFNKECDGLKCSNGFNDNIND